MHTDTPESLAACYDDEHGEPCVPLHIAIKLERERDEAMRQNAYIPRSGLALGALMVKHGILDAAVTEDPEGYDGGRTLAWIDKEIERVTELMKRRPSKIRHLRDLERQKRDRQQILEANVTSVPSADEKTPTKKTDV